MEKEKILRISESEIKMPKRLLIGDLEALDFIGDSMLDYIYDKQFRGKSNWFGLGRVKEVEITFDDDKDIIIKNIIIEGFWAKEKAHIDVYKENQHYTYQKINNKLIVAESASFSIETLFNKEINYNTINSGTDGVLGSVIEYKKGNSVEGISFSIDCSDVNSYERIQSIFNYLFDCELKEISNN